MPRAAMANLINKVEKLIGDETNAVHTADEVEDALDRTRQEWRYLQLIPIETRSATSTSYNAFASPVGGDWEEDPTFWDSTYTSVTMNTSNYELGRWERAGLDNTDKTIYINGSTYDPFMAAALLLEQWAVELKLEYTLSSGGNTLNRHTSERSAKHVQILELAAHYRRRAKAQSALMMRDDIRPGR